MTDLGTRIQELFNAAVDAELGGRRPAPEFDHPTVTARSDPARALRAWSLPVLAASIAVLLVVSTVIAISHAWTQHPGPGRNLGGPSTTADPQSFTTFCNASGPTYATSTYEEAAAGAQEATETAGVSVGPVSAQDAAAYESTYTDTWVKLDGSASNFGSNFGGLQPVAGRTYSFIVKYLAARTSDPQSVLSIELRDVIAGSCPKPFLIRPNHTYLIRCQVIFRPGYAGELAVSPVAPNGGGGGRSLRLTDVAEKAPSPSSPSSADRAAAYAKAAAGAPEATEVAGVSVAPTSNPISGYTGLGAPFQEFMGKPVVPGRKYPFIVEYIVAPGDDAVSLLTLELSLVSAGSCPKPFLIRAGNTYRIRCQVTFLTSAAGQLAATRESPTGGGSQTTPLIEPGS